MNYNKPKHPKMYNIKVYIFNNINKQCLNKKKHTTSSSSSIDEKKEEEEEEEERRRSV